MRKPYPQLEEVIFLTLNLPVRQQTSNFHSEQKNGCVDKNN